MSFKKYSDKGCSKLVVKNPNANQLKQKSIDALRVKTGRRRVNAEIEKRGGCEFCGAILHNSVYQWHHIWDDDPTKKPVSQILGRASEKTLKKEMDKCVLLCPTCHTTFHMDLCCMFEHKQKHIDGTYHSFSEEDSKEFVVESKNKSLLNFLT